MQSRHRRFLWSDPEEGEGAIKVNTTYRAGDPILVYVHEQEEFGLLTLPSPFGGGGGGGGCEVPNPVRYMEDRETECHVQLEEVPDCRRVEALDAASMVKGFAVVKSPGEAFNATSRKKMEKTFIPVDVQLCERYGDGTTCVQPSTSKDDGGALLMPRPTLNCANVLKELRLEIHHNGTSGIEQVIVRVFISDLEPQGDNYIVQRFGYSHFWTGTRNVSYADKSSPVPRSGNPGYLKGKPLIVGMLKKTDEDGVTVDADSWMGLSLMPMPSTGHCLTAKGSRY